MDRDFRVAGDQPATTDPALPAGADTVAVNVAREDLPHLATGLVNARMIARSQAAILVDDTTPGAVAKRAHLLAEEAALARVADTVRSLR